MKGRWSLALALWGTLWSLAAGLETYAFRFATAPWFAEVRNAERLDAQTRQQSKSCFFDHDDELFDVTPWFREQRIPLEKGWVVWNRSRKLLVVQASIFEQCRILDLSGFNEQPKLTKINLEWFRGGDILVAPSPDRKPNSSLIISTRSGTKADGSIAGGEAAEGYSAQAEIEPLLPTHDEFIDLRLVAEWSPQAEGKGKWKLNTGISIPVEKRFMVAGFRSTETGDSWLLTVKGEVVGSDGTPRAETVWHETQQGPKSVRWSGLPSRAREVVELPDGRLVLIRWMPPDLFKSLCDLKPPEDGDPFEKPSSAARPMPNLRLPDAAVPAHLAKWLASPGIDLRGPLRDRGIAFSEEESAIYDFHASVLVLCCRKRESLDLLEQLLEPCCPGQVQNIRCHAWLAERQDAKDRELSRVFLTGRSGQRGVMSCHLEQTPVLVWQVEPTLGSSDALVDLGWTLESSLPGGGRGTGRWKRSASATLPNDQEVVQDCDLTPNGRQLRLGLKAVVAVEDAVP